MEIPRILWCYWHDEALPPLIAELFATFPTRTWDVRRLWDGHPTLRALEAEAPREAANARRGQRQHFADWLRLRVLGAHGGAWVDITTRMNDAAYLDAFADAARGFEAAMFDFPSKRTSATYPALENYVILAPPRSPFVLRWRDEFDFAFTMDWGDYSVDVQLGARTGGRRVDPQRIYASGGTYVTQSMCAQVAMMLDARRPEAYLLWRCGYEGGGPYAAHVAADGNADRFAARWTLPQYPLVKVSQGQRAALAVAATRAQ